ncbi:BTAD domain-containing putative transcriptional regulator [Actinoplanes sp. NPDC049118]|uniref:AfsR/SARP family transcriptional regulator n=1 Tax=Actinoplanes sp. NPDC049118 TaxID=3155769 RepID=UPI00340675FA
MILDVPAIKVATVTGSAPDATAVRLLGPVALLRDGTPCPLPGIKTRYLLAVLSIHANRLVAIDTLADVLWPQRAPRTFRNNVQVYVSKLRRILRRPGDDDPPMGIETWPEGYLLRTPGRAVDLDQVRHLAEESRRADRLGDLERAVRLSTEALSGWDGQPLADLSGVWADDIRQALQRERLGVLATGFDQRLRHGDPADAVEDLYEAVAAHPLTEILVEQLMVALSRCGRQAEALTCYAEARQRFIDRLGDEPGRRLRELHERILRRDEGTDPGEAPPTTPVTVQPAGGIPSGGPVGQLPPDISDFTGRDPAVASLLSRLGPAAAAPGAPTTTGVMLYGPGGIGKTTLGVRVAHLLRDRYPGGQLFVDLDGARPEPTPPAAVLAGFLRALGVDGKHLPDTCDERSRLFRSLVADRGVLVVLDNAGHEAQVRPLLPGSGCGTLVTSRRPLVGLEGFTAIRLETLPPADAATLLGRICGPRRTTAEPAAAQRIAQLCGGLPLALRAAGARLTAKPHWSLGRMAARLDDEHRRLDELAAGDLAVRASLGLSYADASEADRRAARALSLIPTVTWSPWSIAAVLDCDEEEAEEIVERLVDAQLVEAVATDEGGRSRYRCHDLVRVFLAERLMAEDPEEVRRVAARRWLDSCLSLVTHAVIQAGERPRARDLSAGSHPGPRHAATVELVDHDPFDWYLTERSTLVTAVEWAARQQLSTLCWRLAHTLQPFFEVAGDWDDWRHTHQLALDAAVTAADPTGEVAIRYGLSRLALDQGRKEETVATLDDVVVRARELDLRWLLADALRCLGDAHAGCAQPDRARECYREALPLSRELGDPMAEVAILHGLGMVHHDADRVDEAVDNLRAALAVVDGSRGKHMRPWVLASLGFVLISAGAAAEAARCGEAALAGARAFNNWRDEILATRCLGAARQAQGRHDEARELFTRALSMSRELTDELNEIRGLRDLAGIDALIGADERATAEATAALRAARTRGYRREEALTLATLGDIHLRAGRRDDAGAALQDSADILHDLRLTRLLDEVVTAVRRGGWPA